MVRALSERFVLVRGLARAAGHWHDFDTGLRERFVNATIERHDLAGNGDQCRRASPIRIAELAEDLRERVLARDPRPPVVIAISLGAMVGLTWLSRRPSELRGLVTINTSAGKLSSPLRRMQPHAIGHTLRAMVERDAVAREERILALTTRRFGRDVELARRQAAMLREQPIARINVLRQIVAAAGFRVDPSAVPREHAPILMLASRGDRMVDPACTVALARAFGATRIEHPDAGHDLTLDDPRWIVERVFEWMSARA
ncbi:alpha/beta fold hydrolase [Nannocystaceae bacterium ST9]